jgi:hypothetical protein
VDEWTLKPGDLGRLQGGKRHFGWTLFKEKSQKLLPNPTIINSFLGASIFCKCTRLGCLNINKS